ncbi:tetratricopeptide repeat protein [Geitlerinema sp. P-1104]|nr:tetratricopeptide repeat protein [Geitlerinema sp. P-1104]
MTPDFVSLSDSRYETLFFGLLDGVEAGWTAQQVAEHLQGRAQDPWFLNWLQRFRHTLMSSRVPNHELARRMVRLRGQGCDPVGETAAEIGEALLAREIPEEVEGESEETGEEKLPVLSESEEEAKVWLERARASLDAEAYEEALENCDRALALNPNLYQVWFNRGLALSKLGRYEETVKSCDRALALNPNLYQAWGNRGSALDNLGRYEEALESYDRALALNSNDDLVWCNRGNALSKLGRYEEALESCDRALALNPNDDMAWIGRGNALLHLGRIDRIVAQLAPPDTAAPHSIPLILLPHKELHLLPLEALFPDCFAISRLPSVQTGLTLQQNRQPATASFLSIDPQAEDLPMADFESAAITHLYAATRLESNAVTPEAVLNHLQTPHRLAHFTGHSWHEFPNPAQSRLSLAQKSALTLGQMLEKLENLSSYRKFWV